jgi:hypothetical protein
MQTLWQDVADAGVDLVLNGHSHGYERFPAMDGAGNANANGVQEIVVGTGGEDFFPMTPKAGNVQIANVFGVLRLSLRPGGYDWRFVPIAGSSASDSGTRSCH